MISKIPTTQRTPRRRYSVSDRSLLSDLETLVSAEATSDTYPLASAIKSKVPIYDCRELNVKDATSEETEALQDEWYDVLLNGPGVLVLKHMYDDHSILDSAKAAFEQIIADEKLGNGAKGDHFAPSSANDRIWNSFSKHCLQDHKSFISYYSNPTLALMCNAYLGPAYRVTSQVNVVKPGGKAQVCHRDYHLGFQSTEQVAQWPRAMHYASQVLTLQGAVAHSDMPLESGPTRLLPYSQKMPDGYMAYRLPEFNEFFLANHVSLPLEKGDGLFFNPALFHAAGENTTADFSRTANLIQVSSAFGKPMETIDSLPLIEACWADLAKDHKREGLSKEVDAFVRALGEGYPFPTNLDNRPPAPGGMAPDSEQDILLQGLREGWTTDRVVDVIRSMRIAAQA